MKINLKKGNKDTYLSFGKRKFRVNNIVVYLLLVLVIFQSLAIIKVDSTLMNAGGKSILQILQRGIFLLAAVLIVLVERSFNMISLFPYIYVLVIYHHPYINSSIGLLGASMLVLYLFMKDEQKTEVFIMYRNFLVLLSLIGIILYFLYLLRFPLPYKVVPYYTGNLSARYINYGITYLYSAGNSIRLCGIFNEPGYFGTILGLLLCSDKMNLKRKSNIILFIAGMLTFSLAFLMLILFYEILICYKKPHLIVLLGGIFILLFFVLPNIDIGIESIQKIISRIQIADGRLVGDNRSTDAIDRVYTNMFNIKGSTLLFGYGYGFTASISKGLTYKSYIIDYGIIGFGIIYGMLFLSVIKYFKNNISVFFFVVCFFISVYQRPAVYALPYFCVLYGGVLRLNQSKVENL